MNGFVSSLCDMDSIAIPEEMLDMRIDEQAVENELSSLSLRYAAESTVNSAAPGDTVFCRADNGSYPDGRTIILYTGVSIPGAEAAAAAVVGRSTGDVFTAALSGRDASLTVEKIIRRTPVEINDGLIASIGIDGVSTVDEYRSLLCKKALENLRLERVKEITRYIMDEMVSRSTFIYDEGEMDTQVKLAWDDFTRQYAEMGMELDASFEDIKDSVVFQIKQEMLAKAFCESRGIEVDKSAIEADADQMVEMMTLMGEDVPDRAELVDEAYAGACLNHVFDYIDGVIAEKMGGSNGSC